MKNIHVLPTDKPSKLFIWMDTLLKINIEATNQGSNQNIYITNSEEIKKGDYGLSKLNEIIKFHSGYDYRYYSKIIITTDQDLIKDGVQAIDDDFLEWFVKNPSCEEVEVVKTAPIRPFGSLYKIIIPKEEPKKNI